MILARHRIRHWSPGRLGRGPDRAAAVECRIQLEGQAVRAIGNRLPQGIGQYVLLASRLWNGGHNHISCDGRNDQTSQGLCDALHRGPLMGTPRLQIAGDYNRKVLL